MENQEPAKKEQSRKKCKYCRDEIAGGHEERKQHSLNCEARKQKLATQRSASATPPTPDDGDQCDVEADPRSAKLRQPNSAHKTHKEKTDTCIVCGKVFALGSHDVEECKKLKGGSLYFAGRRRTKGEIQSQIQRRKDRGLEPNPYKLAKSVTPDIGAYNQKLKALVHKKLPPVYRTPPNLQWTHCPDCGKRLVLAHLPEHRDNVCIVRSMENKLEQLRQVSADNREVTTDDAEENDGKTTNDEPAPAPSGGGTSETKTKKKQKSPMAEAKESRKSHPNRVLNGLSQQDAVVEEALNLIAVLDAVVPIADLFLSSVNHLSPVLDPTLQDIEFALPTIAERLRMWKEDILFGGSSVENNNVSRTMSVQNNTSISSSASSKKGAALPKLSDLLHAPRLHLRPSEERKVHPHLGTRTAELAQSKSAKSMGGLPRRAGSPEGAGDTDEGGGHNNSTTVESEDDDEIHAKFDPEVIRLAQAIVAGEMTMSEAMYPERYPTKQQRIYGSGF